MIETTTPTICRICKEGCGILVRRDGGGVSVRGNPAHPVSKGFTCFRGKHFAEVHSSPVRLRLPLLRRGSGWEEISFENALEVLSSNLRRCGERHGARSVAFLKGESLKHQEIDQYMRHLASAFGTPNHITVGSLCHQSMAMAFGMTIGGIPIPDFDRMRTAVIWGANPAVSFPGMWVSLKRAVREGTRLVVIDPCRTRTSEHAHLHLPVTPGSDGPLALAFIKVAVEEARLRPGPSSATGWNEMEALVRGLSYEHLLGGTGIGLGAFHEAAALIFGNLPGWVQTGLGLELQPGGVQTIRAMACLQSLLDPENRPTGAMAPLAPLPASDRYPAADRPIGGVEIPVYTLASRGSGQGMLLPRAILENDPYPIRAMLVVGSNPLLTYPDSALYGKAFKALDFLAVFDLFMTRTAELANLVFPAADFLESLELHDYCILGHSRLGLVRPTTPEPGGWPAWKLFFELARSLGLEDFFPWRDNREALAYRLAGTGVTLEQLLESPSSTVAYNPVGTTNGGWNTPDGKVQMASRVLEAAGYSAIPVPETMRLPLGTDERFRFWLSTGDRVACFQHSQFREQPTYRAAMPEPRLELHPDAASQLGLRSEDLAELSTRHGSIRVRAHLTPDVRRDCLRITHGWAGANVNVLTNHDHLDPVSGFPWMRAVPARVEKRTE